MEAEYMILIKLECMYIAKTLIDYHDIYPFNSFFSGSSHQHKEGIHHKISSQRPAERGIELLTHVF